ncbi:PadR family transcriptional regulator [Evansella tamaricis]|uniref:PadR family transcriptional regulator n=1 Tax=Evansella tamaricis TaxID=2069301 RepID=A0ABS6JHD8_9BACI|nr:PadR family transcriptional regulator [Evansella tamaricis]MBU9712815.1 PadR family transcriptional regulator [Evansella tamaricis]
MSDPLKQLKNSMKKTVFKDFSFSEDRRNVVKESIQSNQLRSDSILYWDDKTLYSILCSIRTGPKHGYEISTLLFQKNNHVFQHKEGQLYALLHTLENKGIIASSWHEVHSDTKKYYSLTKKGRIFIRAVEKQSSRFISLKKLLQEASI